MVRNRVPQRVQNLSADQVRFSTKYLGIVDGSMGILTRRKNIPFHQAMPKRTSIFNRLVLIHLVNNLNRHLLRKPIMPAPEPLMTGKRESEKSNTGRKSEIARPLHQT